MLQLLITGLGSLFPGFFWLQFLLSAVYCSCLPLTLTGSLFRVNGLLLLAAWYCAGLDERRWCRALRTPVILLFTALVLYQACGILSPVTRAGALDFAEGRLWMLALLFTLPDLQARPGFLSEFRKFWLLALGTGLLYGLYQSCIGLPDLRHNLLTMPAPGQASLEQTRLLWRVNSSEIFGTFLYPNLFAHFCLLGFLSLPLLFGNAGRKGLACGAAVGVGLLLAAFQSGAKGPWVALLAALGFCGWLWLRKRFKLGLSISLIAVVVSFSLMVELLLHEDWRESAWIRLGYWQASWDMLLAHPFGVGAGNYAAHYQQFMGAESTIVRMAHFDHMQVLCESGWLGFLLYTLFYASLLLWNRESFDTTPTIRPAPAPAWPVLVFVFFLAASCLVLKVGPMDIRRYGYPFFAALSLLAYAALRMAPLGSGMPGRWQAWSLVLYFAIHGCVDFPFYDHGLLGLFLVLVLAARGPVQGAETSSRWVKLALLLALLLPCGLAARRHFTLMDFSGQLRRAEPIALAAVCRDMPDEATLWELAYERIMHQQASGGVDVKLANTCLDNLLRHQPRSANLCLAKARSMDKDPAAREWYERAMNLAPRQPRHAHHYALYLRQLGEPAEARRVMDLALRLHAHAEEMAKKHVDFRLLMLSPAELQQSF